MSNSNKVFRINRPGLQYVVMVPSKENIADDMRLIADAMNELELGQTITIEVAEMTTEELQALPEIDE